MEDLIRFVLRESAVLEAGLDERFVSGGLLGDSEIEGNLRRVGWRNISARRNQRDAVDFYRSGQTKK